MRPEQNADTKVGHRAMNELEDPLALHVAPTTDDDPPGLA